jgi:hypothetical protein
VLPVPTLEGLRQRQLTSGSVIGLPEDALVGVLCQSLLQTLGFKVGSA